MPSTIPNIPPLLYLYFRPLFPPTSPILSYIYLYILIANILCVLLDAPSYQTAPCPHTGENQTELIIEVIREYGISTSTEGPQIGYFVTDNTTNNDVAINIVLLHFFPQMDKKTRRARRLRCLGHVINPAAKAFLYGNDYAAFEQDIERSQGSSDQLKELNLWRTRGPIGKLHNIVVFICRSPQRRERFADLSAEQKGAFDHLNLVVDNATRWNSLYSMVQRALLLRDRIVSFCIANAEVMHGSLARKARVEEDLAHLLKNDALNAEDWIALTEVANILQIFFTLTKRAESSKSTAERGVLADYMTTLNILLDHVRNLRDDYTLKVAVDPTSTSNVYLKTCTINCWTKLDSYFSLVDETPAHYASVVTVPKSKWQYFQHTWKNAVFWQDSNAPDTWLPNGRAALDELWQEYRRLPIILDEISDIGSKRQREPSPDEFDKASNMADLYGDSLVEDELERWISERPFPLKNETLPVFWLQKLQQRAAYRLARMALDMASIPAMSSDCERVFSQSKLLITVQRHSLKADIIEATQCLRMWLIEDMKAAGTWTGKGNWKTLQELFNYGEVVATTQEDIQKEVEKEVADIGAGW